MPLIHTFCSVITYTCTSNFFILHLVSCGVPTFSGNSSIEAYQNTTEGAEIFFRCNPGFIPAGRMRAVCRRNRWKPDPANHRCTGEIYISYNRRCFLVVLSQLLMTDYHALQIIVVEPMYYILTIINLHLKCNSRFSYHFASSLVIILYSDSRICLITS